MKLLGIIIVNFNIVDQLLMLELFSLHTG